MESRPATRPAFDPIPEPASTPVGDFVDRGGRSAYRISAYHRMDPFLMSVPSDTDLWMFVASSGGLAAGRVDADGSLFPYRTVDELYDAHRHSGPTTLIRVVRGDGGILWEPFADADTENPLIDRALEKNVEGNQVVFEEIHHGLGLAFRYRWAACDEFGWIRTATIENRCNVPVLVDVIDGLRDILPHGAPLGLYQQAGTLVDAYKTAEVDPGTGLGVFALTAGITDRAEALEVLRANTVWHHGLEGAKVHLSASALSDFRNGRLLSGDRTLNGERGNYLVSSRLDLDAGASAVWHFAADSGRDHGQVAGLRRRILDDADPSATLEQALDDALENLRRNVASADGLQTTGRPESWAHHFANVLFNNMRGGVFDANHDVPVKDFGSYLATRNIEVAQRHADLLAGLPETVHVDELRRVGRESGDPDLARLAGEYLPLHFGRRHGDPSRPWNAFAIRVRNDQGERELNYQGNWRDIFQNWEALATAFPGFLPGIVTTFVDASTVDGFNPYRITREGVDWEVVEPDDPWSNIGYWGDHQIVYLLRLLEMLDRYAPETLGEMLGDAVFSYAEVPYRLKPYADIVRDPSDTIDFDDDLHRAVMERAERLGGDGRLLHDADGSVRRANLLEKLLVPMLSKLSNLVPGAGIWMNTQRPEWNDANNVLAGGGVSVVTLCHLRRYLDFLSGLLADDDRDALPVAAEVAAWFEGVATVLENERDLLAHDRTDPRDRRRVMDALGGAFDAYRSRVYDHGLTGATDLPLARVRSLCSTALAWVDRDIAANRRDDGLYHAYNILEYSPDGASAEVHRLQEMLEGQVAVLSSGLIDPDEAVEILDRLFASDMYDEDERSFTLYPARPIAGFLERNRVAQSAAAAVPLVAALLDAGDDSVIARDADGHLRFHADAVNADALSAALDRLGARDEWADAVTRDRDAILELFESVFSHRSYTGRSAVMYAYEGQGCIYWHMVAKLLLAVQEILLTASRDGAPDTVRDRLAAHYFRVRSGIGYEKTVAEYGAFPTDPYSHTPASGGARQPGTTGQVKEEVLTRLGELGVGIEGGTVAFRPTLLTRDEFVAEPAAFRCYDVNGETVEIPLPADGLGFTLCQTPVVYELCDGPGSVRVHYSDGTTVDSAADRLDGAASAELFARTGRIGHIHVGVPRASLGGGS